MSHNHAKQGYNKLCLTTRFLTIVNSQDVKAIHFDKFGFSFSKAEKNRSLVFNPQPQPSRPK